VRVAVIGTGSMGATHARLLASMPEVAEVLVVDADPARATSVATETGGRVVTDDEAISEADAIVIATPAEFHAATVEAAVAAGVPALCEKPLTEDLASSATLVEVVERAGAHVEIGFQRRHEASFAEVQRRVADGSTGRLTVVRLTAFDPRGPERPASVWADTEAAPIFLHSSVHDFDIARWITGAEVTAVFATGRHRDGSPASDPRDIETAAVTLSMSDGTLATLDASWLHPGGYDVRVEVVGERAHLTAGLSPRTPAEHLDWTDGAGGDTWTGYLERFADAYRAELIAFLAAVRGEAAPSSSARDGHEALRVAVAATRSHVEGRRVALDEI
jgi:myo-inositol 2-dehydrogenase/D-chiro-inositol 1-dehydrogenase